MSTRAVVVRSRPGSLTQDVTNGPHLLVSDEPSELGGHDAGPTPYDLLLAALGSCTSMTVTLYARRKQWPLEAVEVALSHTRVHRKDCDESADVDRHLDRIEVRLTLRGPLTAEQRTRLEEIARRCPVHRTLTGRLEIHTLLADRAPEG